MNYIVNRDFILNYDGAEINSKHIEEAVNIVNSTLQNHRELFNYIDMKSVGSIIGKLLEKGIEKATNKKFRPNPHAKADMDIVLGKKLDYIEKNISKNINRINELTNKINFIKEEIDKIEKDNRKIRDEKKHIESKYAGINKFRLESEKSKLQLLIRNNNEEKSKLKNELGKLRLELKNIGTKKALISSANKSIQNIDEGIQIKTTSGSIKSSENLILDENLITQTRVSKLSSLTWQSHHQKCTNLMGVIWDFINNVPVITAIYYIDGLCENSWAKVDKDNVKSEKGTNDVSSLRSFEINKMYKEGKVLILDDSTYINKYKILLEK